MISRAFFRRHPKLANTALLLCSILLTGAVVEIVARALVSVPTPYAIAPEYMSNDQRGFWAVRPGLRTAMDNRVDFSGKQVTIDENSVRLSPCAAAADDQPGRIYLLGDSQTFGWGLSDEETWANKLQCHLLQQRPGAYRVINLGVPGTQADQFLNRGVQQVLPVIEPGDFVVVSLTWNDLLTFYTGDKFVSSALNTAGLRRTTVSGRVGVAVVPSADQPSIPTDSKHRFEIIPRIPPVLIPAVTWRYRLYNRTGIFIPSFDSVWGFLDSARYISATLHYTLPKLRLLYYRLRAEKAFLTKFSPHSVEQNFLVVKALETMVRRKSGKLAVQLLPNRLFFDDHYYAAYSKSGQAFPERDFMAFVGLPLCKNLGLHCVNRFKDLQTDQPNAYSFAHDGHYNDAGASRIADALAQDILSTGSSQ